MTTRNGVRYGEEIKKEMEAVVMTASISFLISTTVLSSAECGLRRP